MNATGTITMSMTELDRLKVVQAVCERRLKPGQAADRLALNVRQVERLVRRYQAAGVAGTGFGQAWAPGQPSVGRWRGATFAGHYSRTLCGFRPDAGLREASGMSRHRSGSRDGSRADDDRGSMDSSEGSSCQGLPAPQSSSVSG